MSEREYIICWFSIQKEKTHKNYTEQAGGGEEEEELLPHVPGAFVRISYYRRDYARAEIMAWPAGLC